MKFNNLGIFQSLKFWFQWKKSLQFFLSCFTPNTLGCFGLTHLVPVGRFQRNISICYINDKTLIGYF